MRVVKGEDQEETTVMVFHRKDISTEIQDALQEVGNLPDLKPGIQEVKVGYGLIQKNDTEIAMLTRSMMQIMVELASQITVPQEHITEGRTISTASRSDDDNYLIRINNSREKPENGFVAVRYRDYWFYIDDRDIRSKRTFAFLMILFSVTETGGKEGLPLVTIPAG